MKNEGHGFRTKTGNAPDSVDSACDSYTLKDASKHTSKEVSIEEASAEPEGSDSSK